MLGPAVSIFKSLRTYHRMLIFWLFVQEAIVKVRRSLPPICCSSLIRENQSATSDICAL